MCLPTTEWASGYLGFATVNAPASQRRSLKYIRLAAYLAGQPPGVDRIAMSLDEVQELVGAALPSNSRFPSWWRNDERKMHSRAWLAAGWHVEKMRSQDGIVIFVRR
jgi:hypothetical protein